MSSWWGAGPTGEQEPAAQQEQRGEKHIPVSALDTLRDCIQQLVDDAAVDVVDGQAQERTAAARGNRVIQARSEEDDSTSRFVQLNVGGRLFTTYRSTITTGQAAGSLLDLVCGSNPKKGEHTTVPRVPVETAGQRRGQAFYFDRDGDLFAHILTVLRAPFREHRKTPAGVDAHQLALEFAFFGIPWPYGRGGGNQEHLRSSIPATHLPFAGQGDDNSAYHPDGAVSMLHWQRWRAEELGGSGAGATRQGGRHRPEKNDRKAVIARVVQEIAADVHSRIELDVGGICYDTTWGTLVGSFPNSSLAVMLKRGHTVAKTSEGRTFLDHDGREFGRALNVMRNVRYGFVCPPRMLSDVAEHLQDLGIMPEDLAGAGLMRAGPGVNIGAPTWTTCGVAEVHEFIHSYEVLRKDFWKSDWAVTCVGKDTLVHGTINDGSTTYNSTYRFVDEAADSKSAFEQVSGLHQVMCAVESGVMVCESQDIFHEQAISGNTVRQLRTLSSRHAIRTPLTISVNVSRLACSDADANVFVFAHDGLWILSESAARTPKKFELENVNSLLTSQTVYACAYDAKEHRIFAVVRDLPGIFVVSIRSSSFLKSWASEIVSRPGGIAVTPDGMIIVVDETYPRLIVLEPPPVEETDGPDTHARVMRVIERPDTEGDDLHHGFVKDSLWSICIDSDGRLVTFDKSRRRLLRWY